MFDKIKRVSKSYQRKLEIVMRSKINFSIMRFIGHYKNMMYSQENVSSIILQRSKVKSLLDFSGKSGKLVQRIRKFTKPKKLLSDE